MKIKSIPSAVISEIFLPVSSLKLPTAEKITNPDNKEVKLFKNIIENMFPMMSELSILL